MTSKIGNIIGKVNEAVGAMKANADHASVREDGKKQEELGRKQQADSADARKTERGRRICPFLAGRLQNSGVNRLRS